MKVVVGTPISFVLIFLLAGCQSQDLMPRKKQPNLGVSNSETVYKPGQPGANWTPEEIDYTRERVLQENATDIVPCTKENKGPCQCGKVSDGFQTYVFMVAGFKRCFTVYIPPDRKEEVLPLMIYSNCYASDRLSGLQMSSKNSGMNKAARQFGYARIAISKPHGKCWALGPNGVKGPYPCTDNSEYDDLTYMRKIFEFIEANGDKFDLSRVYAHGFSVNSAWSNVIGVCFGDKVRGVFLGGQSMSVNGKGGGHPIYPCYTPKKPLIVCVTDYKNDPRTNAPKWKKGIFTLYNAMLDEGHDVRLFRFSKSADGSIKGVHKDPQNVALWQVGCLGLSTPCSKECEDKVISCTENGDISSARKRSGEFRKCMSADSLESMGCPSDCAPTFNMLASSEVPKTFGDKDGHLNFGNIEYSNNSPRPETSLCIAEEQ